MPKKKSLSSNNTNDITDSRPALAKPKPKGASLTKTSKDMRNATTKGKR